ncbi:MAG: hypothetical protein MAG581_00064 [Deltaproteobacteria bacterium]|nr:hypothetical protein [Deltaproteobacteria bacterium]
MLLFYYFFNMINLFKKSVLFDPWRKSNNWFVFFIKQFIVIAFLFARNRNRIMCKRLIMVVSPQSESGETIH